MSVNVEAEIRDLKRRVSGIEGSFGFLVQQIRGVHHAPLQSGDWRDRPRLFRPSNR
jgi:hypothetical protein